MSDVWNSNSSSAISVKTGNQPYSLSADELNVLKECNKESFSQRSVPISTILSIGTYACVKKGYLMPNSRFGATPKVALAIIFGYFLGKISYQQRCAEKFIALPNSYLGQMLRDRKNGTVTQYQADIPPEPNSEIISGETETSLRSSLNLDTDRPNYDMDSYSGYTSSISTCEELSPTKLSYDDIRKSNREINIGVKRQPIKVDPRKVLVTTPVKSLDQSSAATNKYGDVIG